MSTASTFTQFLFDRTIISKQQADVLNSSLRDGDESICINTMTDFFSSMSPSDSYDLAFRLYTSWIKASSFPPSRQETTEESIHIYNTPIQTKNHSRKINNEQSNSARSKRSASPLFNDVRSRLTTNGSNNNNFYSVQSSDSVYNKLYSDASKKNAMMQQYQDLRERAETEECTFQPNHRRSPKRTNGEVFDRLQQDLRRFKQEINENKRLEMEMRNCTFSPTINSSTLIDGDESTIRSTTQTFERLYNDKKLKELHTYENEMRKLEKEMAGCTFKPVLSPKSKMNRSRMDESDTERFNRLYKDHGEKLRKNEQKFREKSEEEHSKYSFRPQRIASPTAGKLKGVNGSEKKVVDRLLDWYNDRKKKIDTKVVEKERKITEDANASLSTKRKRRDLNETNNDSIPAYDRLYKEYYNKKFKNEALEKKVMKQIGASFTPKINRTRSLSNSSRGTETYHSRAVNNTRPASPAREFVPYGRKNNSIQYSSVNEMLRGK